MSKKKKIKLQRMIGQAGDVAFELRSLHFSDYCRLGSWVPAVNAYRYENRFELAVDLAGVELRDIEVTVESRRIIIKGERVSPTPPIDEPTQVLAMEIENGPFCRQLTLPEPVNVAQATTRFENGLLWVDLPFEE